MTPKELKALEEAQEQALHDGDYQQAQEIEEIFNRHHNDTFTGYRAHNNHLVAQAITRHGDDMNNPQNYVEWTETPLSALYGEKRLP